MTQGAATLQDYKYLVHASTHAPVQGTRSIASLSHSGHQRLYVYVKPDRKKKGKSKATAGPPVLISSYKDARPEHCLWRRSLCFTDVVVSTEAEQIKWQTSHLLDYILHTVFEKIQGEMKREHGQPLLALWALFLHCTSQQTASSSSSSQVSTRVHVETPLSKSPQIEYSFRNDSQIPRRPAAGAEEPLDHMTFTTSRATVMPGRSPRSQSRRSGDGVSPLCAYRVIEGGVGGQVCFRHTLPEYKCQEEQCKTVVSSGNLVANILINGSVLLQWTQGGQSTLNKGNKTNGESISKDHGTNITTSHSVVSGRRHRRGGFELSCWWNGSYTQFECTGVQLAHGCRDYLLTELHENIPYRFCLRFLDRPRAQVRDCVEFTLPPSGMQDIVIAMTTVGGAICVMLVIICLLVAYITENIMSPTTTHTYSYRSHSCH